jgi:tetratricopeptide (TPR) repeat protein
VPSLLSTDSRDVTPRHRTFWDTVAWSHALLSEDEQRMFRRLAVFRDGWQLDAVEAVTDLGDLPNPIETLTGLVDKSLVQVSAGDGDEPRVRMLVPVREFAADQLSQCGEEPEIRNRHASYFTEMGEIAGEEILGPNEVQWLDRCELELSNIRAALAWDSNSGGDFSRSLRLASGLWWFWQTRIGFAEGRAWLRGAQDPTLAIAADLRKKALTASAWLACFQADYLAAEALARDATNMSNEGDHSRDSARAAYVLGVANLLQMQTSQAEPLLESACHSFSVLGDQAYEGFALLFLGALHAFSRDDPVRGRPYLDESLRQFRSNGFMSGVAMALGNLGALVLKQGDLLHAEALIRESLGLRISFRDRWGMAQELRELSHVALMQSEEARAVRLYAASLALLESLQTEAPAAFVDAWRENEERLRSMADDPAFADAWRSGYSDPFEHVAREAHALTAPIRDPLGY